MHSNGRVKLTFSIYETLLFLHYNVKILDIYKQNFNYFKICLKENFRFVKISLRDEKFEPQINIDLYRLGVCFWSKCLFRISLFYHPLAQCIILKK